MTAMIGLPKTKGGGKACLGTGMTCLFLASKTRTSHGRSVSDDELLAPGQERAVGVLFALRTLWGQRQFTAVA